MAAENSKWRDGIFGVVVGDALGCPVQFESREEVSRHPVTGMRGYGVFNMPEGSWTDDSSLTLALLESIKRLGRIDLDDIMGNFMKWLYDGEFTPFGQSYDIGGGTMRAIDRYRRDRNAKTCGGTEDYNNGNGSLMRILPACIFCSEKVSSGEFSVREAVETVHAVGSLTHATMRACIGCGLYFFMVHHVLAGSGALKDLLQAGLSEGFAFYEDFLTDKDDLRLYDRLQDLDVFGTVAADKIKGSGYVLDSLEAAVWSLITTGSYGEAMLKAVNLGEDTDTVAAIAGGLGGLYYGYDGIPQDWLAVIKRREWIEGLLPA